MNSFELHALRFGEDTPPPAAPAREAPVRCLLVEDSRFDRSLLRYAAERSAVDIRFIEVATLAEARRCLAETKLDLVILDQALPDGHGMTLAEEMAADPALCDVARIMVTGSEDRALADWAHRAGCICFITKKDLSPQAFATVLNSLTLPSETLEALETGVSDGMSLLLGDLEGTARQRAMRQVTSRLAGLLHSMARQGRDPAMVEEVLDLTLRLWMEVEGPDATRDEAMARFG